MSEHTRALWCENWPILYTAYYFQVKSCTSRRIIFAQGVNLVFYTAHLRGRISKMLHCSTFWTAQFALSAEPHCTGQQQCWVSVVSGCHSELVTTKLLPNLFWRWSVVLLDIGQQEHTRTFLIMNCHLHIGVIPWILYRVVMCYDSGHLNYLNLGLFFG